MALPPEIADPRVWSCRAGVLLLALQPLQRAAGRIAERAMLRVHDTSEYVGARKRAVCRAALEGAVSDGAIAPKERDTLTRLQLEFGIANAQARGMELAMAGGAR